jgi:putative transcriptional regulator
MEKPYYKSEADKVPLAATPKFTPQGVRRLRKASNVSQQVFARSLGTHPSTVCRWESGINRPSIIALKLLAIVEKHGLKVLF